MVFMSSSDTLILIIDVQEKLLPGIVNKEELLCNIKSLVLSSNILSIKMLYSEQCPHKLGKTVKDIKEISEERIIAKETLH